MATNVFFLNKWLIFDLFYFICIFLLKIQITFLKLCYVLCVRSESMNRYLFSFQMLSLEFLLFLINRHNFKKEKKRKNEQQILKKTKNHLNLNIFSTPFAVFSTLHTHLMEDKRTVKI